jgi:MFS family permease
VPNKPFFLAALAWNCGHGMSWMALPLYAAYQGLSNAEIGAIIALPVFAQAPLNLMGGAYTDRIGGKRILLASACAMALAALWFQFAHGFGMLLFGQICLVLSRAVFWPATWAIASELPGARGVQLGRLNAMTNFGQIAGNVACGLLLAAFGFGATFGALAGVALLALLAAFMTPGTAPRLPKEKRHVLAAYVPLLSNRTVQYSAACAYLSGVPFSLSLSFFPLLLAEFGHGEGVSGVVLALRSVGAIGAALIASRFVRSGPRTLWPVVCGGMIVVAVGVLPLLNVAPVIGMWMMVAGIASGAMTLYFQMTISDASRPEERGSALALGGIGWNVSLFVTPLLMGFLADRYGLVTSFYCIAATTLAGVVALELMRRWAFRA